MHQGKMREIKPNDGRLTSIVAILLYRQVMILKREK